jgi:hypothetical protein
MELVIIFEVFRELEMRVVVFCVVTTCFVVGGYHRFGLTYRFLPQGTEDCDDTSVTACSTTRRRKTRYCYALNPCLRSYVLVVTTLNTVAAHCSIFNRIYCR